VLNFDKNFLTIYLRVQNKSGHIHIKILYVSFVKNQCYFDSKWCIYNDVNNYVKFNTKINAILMIFFSYVNLRHCEYGFKEYFT
jgi:hypothetical protein